MWKEAVVDYFKLLSKYFAGGSESRYLNRDMNPGIQRKYVNH